MTGPEHYREAERLLSCEARDDAHEALLVAAAQVNATLALAAATATPMVEDRQMRESWHGVLS